MRSIDSGTTSKLLALAALLSPFGLAIASTAEDQANAAAERFAPGIVSTDGLEHSAPAISPDGTEMFWSGIRFHPDKEPQAGIHFARRGEVGWSSAEAAPFSGQFNDDGPTFSPDGKHLYFSSKRPNPDRPDTVDRNDIWRVSRTEDGWGTPECLNLARLITEESSVANPSVTRDGTIYFVAYAGQGGPGKFFIYRARRENGHYTEAEKLDESINLPDLLNWTPFIAPDESFLLFSSNREGSRDNYGDIFLSARDGDDTWQDPIRLNDVVNTPAQERFPAISLDGKKLFFTRWTPDHDQDVFVIETPAVPELANLARTTRLSPDLVVRELADGVWLHTSWRTFASGARYPSNGVIVREKDSLVLVDTPWGEDLTLQLLNWAEDALRLPFSRAIVTHAHDDRMIGAPHLVDRGIKVFGHPLSGPLAVAQGWPAPTPLEEIAEPGSVVTLGSVEVLYPGPAHTADNIMVWIPSARILVGGCAVRGGDSRALGNIAEADVPSWPTTIRRAQEYFETHDALVIPGHGEPGGIELLEHTLRLVENYLSQ